jgi:uroporphyrin-III C-methyltransferase
VVEHKITPPTLIVIGEVVNQLTEQELSTPGFLKAEESMQFQNANELEVKLA